MNKNLVSLVGMTFSKDRKRLQQRNPSGQVGLIRDMQHDKDKAEGYPATGRGVKVTDRSDLHLGWLSNCSKQQDEVNAMMDEMEANGHAPLVSGIIVECDYSGSKPWCTIEYSASGEPTKEEPVSEKKDDGHFEFYEKDGKQYERLSHVASRLQLEEDTSGLDDWKFKTFNSVAEYNAYMKQAADRGITMHSSNECACRLGIVDSADRGKIVDKIPAEKFDFIPVGFWKFLKAECDGMKTLGVETTVYDDENLIAGTYDLLVEQDGKKIVIDWKSSKQVYPGHLVKTAWYAYMAGADEAWVVAWGSKNKCGYQLKKVKGQAALKYAYETIRGAAHGVRSVRSFFKALKG